MGLLRDAIGSAMGGDQVKNGLNGPKFSFSRTDRPDHYQSPPSLPSNTSYVDQERSGYGDSFRKSQEYALPAQSSQDPYGSPPPYQPAQQSSYTTPPAHLSPNEASYRTSNSPYPPPIPPRTKQPSTFQPIALPQLTHGDGSPFLRGYSSSLSHHGIHEREFFELVDSINAAVIPSPENQIFQKAAGIAGWFLPGAASLGLMAGQFGVGVGAAFGHSAAINKVLSKANLEVFIPRGLEICIAKSKDLDAILGVAAPTRASSVNDIRPEDRLAAYGGLLAPITHWLPPLERSGRSDPIAVLGKGIGDKSARKKLEKAREGLAKGKGKKAERVEGGFQWLVVKEASSESVGFWRRNLQESEAALEREQMQRGGY